MCAFFAYDPTKGAIKVTGDVTTSVDDKLGTPGTGEPAHAGGSTGLIGWARDILAKIAAFGTSGVPSANVISVQGPPNQYGSITFTGANQSLTLNCEGMASATFYCRASGVLGIQLQLDYGDGTWKNSEFLFRSPAVTGLSMQYYMVTPELNAWYGCSTKGAKRVRLIAVFWTSGGVFDGVVSASPIYSAVEIAGNTTLSNVTTVGTVSIVSQINGFAATAYGAQFADTTIPLASGATFTGSARNSSSGSIGSYTVTVNSDQASVGNGVKIQRSVDFLTWFDSWAGALTANTPLQERVWVTDPFMRVSYTNGATPQTSFLLSSATRVN